MPAMLEDPTAPVVYRTSGEMPYPAPGGPLPMGIAPRQVTLRDRVTTATLIPFSSPNDVPPTLLAYLSDQFGREIEKGDTYPMLDPMPLEAFGPYWFGVFGAIMLLGDISGIEEVHRMARQGYDWEKACLGSFYIKPNYPGRSSHICNGGFLTTDGARNRGVGRLMGETYIEWAPRLGYTYSVFNLVYETNVASCRIWDALGFKRIGRVKGCGNLRSFPGEMVDAIIYGRDLGQEDDLVSEERFDKIRFYLKNGKYPNGADRAEKSRLRSAATHYKLIAAQGDQPERLMLKGKEVISDPQKQYEIARHIHHRAHGGINKTTATIAESYHWVRIKETVSQVIRNCPECSEMNKGLAQVRAQRFLQPPSGLHHLASARPQYPRTEREESPSDQLQMEAAQHAQATQSYPMPPGGFGGYEMPLDPALMDSVSQQPVNLEDLPPSPFLAASRTLPIHIPPISSIPSLPKRSSSELHSTSPAVPDRMESVDTVMTGAEKRIEESVDERAPSAREEIRRRLTRAGYAAIRRP